MSDLISRKDALKAVCIGALSAATVYGRSEAGMAAKREIERAIADLSSAQPEIIHCAECKYQDKGSNESNSWNLCGYRPWIYVPTSDEHYCGYAERKIDG